MKRNKMRFLAVFLLLAMLIGLFPMGVFAEEAEDKSAATRATTPNAQADVVEIALDYAKTIEIPTATTIYKSIETDANTTVSGLLGITATGTHNNIVTTAPTVKCAAAGDTYAAKYGTFARVQTSSSSAALTYQPTKFMADLEKVYLVYLIRVSGTAKYLYVELRLVPGTTMYYETDFSSSEFESYSTDGLYYFDTDNSFYADFTNTDLDKERYEKNVYGGKNYDLAENWNALPTDPDTNIAAYTAPRVENGELKVDFAAYDANRKWIWVQANGNLDSGFSLNFHPDETYVVQVRVKFHDLVATSTPYLNLYYFTGVDRWEGVAADYGDRTKEKLYRLKQHHAFTAEEAAALNSNEYITITFPVGQTASESHTIMTNMRFQFGNILSVSDSALGGFTLDYVYVGPETSAPSRHKDYAEDTHLQDALFFDYSGTAEDLNRYGTHNYLSQNFDVASAWRSTTSARIESVAVDQESSALVFTSKYDTEQPNFTIYNPKDFRYTPANAEVFQIRFKLKNYVAGSTSNQLVLSYWALGASTWTASVATKQFPASCLNSDEYVTIQMELPDSLRAEDTLKTLRLQMTGLESSSATELGTMTIDYIYIGPKATAPTEIQENDYLLFSFENNEADRNRYVNDPAYGGFNFDVGNWAAEGTTNSKAYTFNHTDGTVSIDVKDKDSDYGPYFAPTKTTGSYPWKSGYAYAPLNYAVPSNAVVKIRFKVTGCTAAKTPALYLLLHYKDAAGTNKYTDNPYVYESFTNTENTYQVVEFDLSDICADGDILTSVGFRFKELDGTSDGKVTIDYIYVGPSELIATEENLDDALYFDFENTRYDQKRYEDNAVYGGKNYDLSSNWSTQTNYYTSPVVDSESGTLHFGFLNNSRNYLWFQTNSDPQYNFAMAYRPQSDHYIYLRLRYNGMIADGTPKVKILYYIGKDIFEGKSDKTERPYELDAYALAEDQVESGEYITLKIPIKRTDNTVHTKWTNIRLLLTNVKSADASNLGTVDVDYIYIGASAPIPTAEPSENYLFYDFKNTSVDQERYASDPAYGGLNYDLASSWRYNTSFSFAPIMDHTAGTMTIGYTVPERIGMWYHFNSSSAGNFNMAYQPASDHYVKVRLKFNNMVANGTPYLRFFYCIEDDIYGGVENSSAEIVYWLDKIYFTEDDLDSNGYITVSVPLTGINSPDHTKWSTLRMSFTNMKSADADHLGTIDIDYIYFGSEENFETVQTENRRTWQTVSDGTTSDHVQEQDVQWKAGALYFDFGNTPTDRTRYTYGETNSYLSQNFDVSSAWQSAASGRLQSITVDNTAGTLNLKAADSLSDNTSPTFAFATKLTLDYSPANAEIFEIRFKLENFVRGVWTDPNANNAVKSPDPSVSLAYQANGTTTWVDASSSVRYYDEALDSGQYITLRGELKDVFKQATGVNIIRFYVVGLESDPNADPGVMTVDYIYIGPKNTAPGSLTYGYDSSYENDSKLSNGSSLFTEGRGNATMYSNNAANFYGSFSETSFSFTGTGFDLISRTGADQGALRVAVYDSDGYCVKIAQVVNKSDLGLELMQVPVLSVDLKNDNGTPRHDTYFVKIFVAAPFDFGNDGNADALEGALDRGGEFYFDAVRIYNTINTASTSANAKAAYALYQKHGEADPEFTEIRNKLIDANSLNQDGGGQVGAVFMDVVLKNGAVFDSKIAEYTAAGANNEVYLANGQAIAFKLVVEGEVPASIDIGAKSVDGTPVNLVTRINTSAANYLPTGTPVTITSATTQFYPLSNTAFEWVVSGNTRYAYVTVYNSGEGILSVTDLKCAYAAPSSGSSKSAQIIVDRELLDALTACEHDYSYTSTGNEHVAQCAICGEAVTEAHSYVDGTCICGATEITELVPDSSLTPQMAISVGAEIQVTYTIAKAKIDSFDSFCLTVSKNVAGGEPTVTTYGMDDDMIAFDEVLNPSTGELLGYRAVYTGIYAAEMGDEFTATVYAVAADGTIHYGVSESSSIKTYLMDKLADNTTSAELKALAVDMLSYGAAAQVNFGYDTENLVNADLTGEQKALGTQGIPSATNASSIAGEGGKMTTSVSLQNKVLLYVNCNYVKTEASNLEFVVKNLNGDVLERFAPSVTTAKICQGVYGNVGARQMRDLITIELYDNGILVSQTLTWNIESYVAQIRADNANSEALIATVNAMLAYGDSAAAYLSASGQ